MQVILIKNFSKLGLAGEIKNVADGYAINYLFPNELARMATKEAIQEMEDKKKRAKRYKDNQISQVQSDVSRLEKAKILIKARVSEKGHLFAAISPRQIVKELAGQCGVNVLEKDLRISQPLKEIGEYGVVYSPVKGMAARFWVKVESSG